MDPINIKIIKECGEKYRKIKNYDVVKTNISDFCKSLRANKVKYSITVFQTFPMFIQCLILNYCWKILINRFIGKQPIYSDDSYVTAFRMFKLFRKKEFRTIEPFDIFYKKDNYERVYDKAYKWQKQESPAVRKPKKKFDKSHQKYEIPIESDPLYIFYTSLYNENPKSKLAITWLAQHGVFDDEERENIENKYAKLNKK